MIDRMRASEPSGALEAPDAKDNAIDGEESDGPSLWN